MMWFIFSVLFVVCTFGFFLIFAKPFSAVTPVMASGDDDSDTALARAAAAEGIHFDTVTEGYDKSQVDAVIVALVEQLRKKQQELTQLNGGSEESDPTTRV